METTIQQLFDAINRAQEAMKAINEIPAGLSKNPDLDVSVGEAYKYISRVSDILSLEISVKTA